MNSMLGANPVEMEQLQSRFTASSGDVETLMSRIDATITQTTWTGPAADRFRDQWNTQFRPALVNLTGALTDNAGIVGQRLAAIRTATE